MTTPGTTRRSLALTALLAVAPTPFTRAAPADPFAIARYLPPLPVESRIWPNGQRPHLRRSQAQDHGSAPIESAAFRTGGTCRFSQSVHFSCMATKTLTLELDAYEKLRHAKRAGESFTEVVRRAVWMDAPATGESLLTYFRNGGSGTSDKYLDAVEDAASHDPIPDDPWA